MVPGDAFPLGIVEDPAEFGFELGQLLLEGADTVGPRLGIHPSGHGASGYASWPCFT